jgi:hypothetical protein
LTSGPTGMRVGVGHSSAPAVSPGGRAHSMRGASPESPGFPPVHVPLVLGHEADAETERAAGRAPPASATSSTFTCLPSTARRARRPARTRSPLG